jgi:DNA-binding response OmpR family regulator
MVEDHAVFSDALRLLLGRRLYLGGDRGTDFFSAPTVAGGLVLVDGEGPFDLAVVDLMLPDGDGTEVVRALKARWPGKPVAVLSGARDLSGALSAGADEAIGKEMPLPEVISRLAGIAGEGDRTTA